LGSGFGFNGGSTNVACTLDFMPVDCNKAVHALIIGAADPCPNNDCGPQVVNGQVRPVGYDPNTGQLGYRDSFVEEQGADTNNDDYPDHVVHIKTHPGHWDYVYAGGYADFFATVFDPQNTSQQVATDREFRYQIWKAAYDLALEALSKSECSTLAITGDVDENAAEVLKGIYKNGNFKYSTTPHKDDTTYGNIRPAATENRGGRERSTIWLYPVFYTTEVADALRRNVGRNDLTNDQTRALALLHELRHAFGDQHPNPGESDKWNKIIADTCFPLR
jgi:hypothetical protein